MRLLGTARGKMITSISFFLGRNHFGKNILAQDTVCCLGESFSGSSVLMRIFKEPTTVDFAHGSDKKDDAKNNITQLGNEVFDDGIVNFYKRKNRLLSQTDLSFSQLFLPLLTD